jgi:SAM-dependent methyltransferase
MLTVDLRRLGVRRGQWVLDAGCGGGRHAFAAYRLGAKVVALDLDGEAVAQARHILASMDPQEQEDGALFLCLRADLLRLPFPDGLFHRIICAETLEHVPDDAQAMAELVRVLRPGGRLAVTVPRYWPEKVCWALSPPYRRQPGGHVRIYKGHQLAGAFQKLGLRLIGRHYAHALHSPYWWLRCLMGHLQQDGQEPLPIRLYHQLLVWDICHPHSPLRWLEEALNPIMGKSLVLYFQKPWRA